MYTAFQLAQKYIAWYWQALNSKGHGVHSPFVFDFIKFVKNDRKNYPCYDEIEMLRRELLHRNDEIDVQDFGAGSTVIKTNRRVVSKMAASSLKPRRFAQLLFRIVHHYQPAHIIELGTSFGITTAYLASGNASRPQVHTLEGSPAIANIAKENFQKLGITNIRLTEGDFNQTLDEVLKYIPTIDLAFIDGNHKQAPTLQYFHQLMEHTTAESILIFDDIHWSEEMEAAWEIIRNDERVTLTIDLFFIGIVFLKKDFKVKQHFKLRF
ncbi:MAG: class I SAM-dependent methyltransferase [Chitinophagaceae bacterium]|nr:MAG: class I SAM-dependent methyltransferase [Chitinophagaceae bacterium]